MQHSIQSRGFGITGVPNLPKSLDFGEGFYCSYPNAICSKQVKLLAKDRAAFYKSKPLTIRIKVNPLINTDSSLKCMFFDGQLNTDGLDWAKYIVHHRVHKEMTRCNSEPCNGHPDLVIGPVADGQVITANAWRVFKGELSILEFYQIISQPSWFPKYRQIVFGKNAIKYISLL